MSATSTSGCGTIPPPYRAVYLAWTTFQRRQVSMAPLCKFDAVLMPVDKRPGRVRKLWSYAKLSVASLALLLRRRPETVWIQLPQPPALWAALLYRFLAGSHVKVIADCHNAQLRKPWTTFPFARWALSRADAVLVHNDAMRARAEELGWPMQKLLVMEDLPPGGVARCASGEAQSIVQAARPWIVFPGSFSADEPVGELLAAARLAPDMSFIVTGRVQNAKIFGHDLSALPPNVLLLGFLPVVAFDDLLRGSDVVLALTREEGIQLSVCNEALGFHRALVASDTVLLRRLFGEAAIMAETSNPHAIVAACRQALAEQSGRQDLSRALARKRIDLWLAGPWEALQRLLGQRS